MRINIIIIVFVAVLVSCKTRKLDDNSSMKEIFVSEFKLHYFKSLLSAGFNNSNDFIKSTSLDKSNFAESILSDDDLALIKNFVKSDADFMVDDSLVSFKKRGEGAEGKQVYKLALKRYESKWLDSLAKARFKVYLANRLTM